MKKNIFLTVITVAILALTGCKDNRTCPNIPGNPPQDSMQEPAFPLEKDTITEALNELHLPWIISEDESEESFTANNALYSKYVLRDPEKKDREDEFYSVLFAGITSGIVDDNRYLSIILDAKSHALHDKPFVWEDWKQEIVLATMLYGGFEDREEVFHALSSLEIPEGHDMQKWGVSLSNGYCGIQKSQVSNSPTPGAYVLWINFYESEELYQKTEKEKMDAYEKAQEDKQRRREEYLKEQKKETMQHDMQHENQKAR